jgi:hypothetical protein
MSITAKRLMRGAGGAGAPEKYIENLFSTFLYTGTGTGYAGNEQNIINGIDVSGKGALIWIKARESTAAYNSYWNRHQLYDTNRGITFALNSNTTDAHGDTTDSMSTRADGFRLASGGSYYQQNFSGVKYVSWTFRQEPKFFDIVTYTGTGSDRTVAHSLGSTVGCIFIKAVSGTGAGDEGWIDVTLGYEPQWLLVKKTSATGDWILMDTMRGMSMTTSQWLYPNAATIEDASGTQLNPTATGFTVTSTGSGLNGGGATYIYIAIRRGPMKVPTVGTSVFSPEVQTPGGGFFTAAANSGFPIDWLPTRQKGVVTDWYQTSRLTNNYMSPNTTATEAAYTYGFDLMQGVRAEWSTNTTVSYAFRRAPGFFDVVAYTGTGAGGRVLNHNLGVAPELMIFKSRASTSDNNWSIQCAFGPSGKVYNLNGTGNYNGTLATSLSASSITLSDNTTNNTVAYVAYLFATCPGVSKVGSYAGSASAVQVDCGFTTGARFVLIKYADGTGGWIVFDSARGIISGNDPYLEFNNTNAEITSEDYIDPYSAGFEISAAAPGVLNGINRTFIFLAIA